MIVRQMPAGQQDTDSSFWRTVVNCDSDFTCCHPAQVVERRPRDLRGGWSYITSKKTEARAPTSGQNTSGVMHRVNQRAKM